MEHSHHFWLLLPKRLLWGRSIDPHGCTLSLPHSSYFWIMSGPVFCFSCYCMKYAEYAGVVLERSQQTVPNAVRIHLGGILQQTAPLFFHQIKLEDHLLVPNGPNFSDEFSTCDCETDLKEKNKIRGKKKRQQNKEIFHRLLSSFPRFFPLRFTKYTSPWHGARHDIWLSILQDDVSTRFLDLQWLRWRFYGHKSNLKTPASWALDASRIILGLNFFGCLWSLYDWRNSAETCHFRIWKVKKNFKKLSYS